MFNSSFKAFRHLLLKKQAKVSLNNIPLIYNKLLLILMPILQ